MIIVWHIIGFGLFFTLMVVVPVSAIIWQDRDYQSRKRKYEEERARRRAELQSRLADLRLQEMQHAVARQKQDQPAVTVPVTRCDRQERRRVLKLED